MKIKISKVVVIDVGVILNDAPYVILALAVIALGVFVFIKKRKSTDAE